MENIQDVTIFVLIALAAAVAYFYLQFFGHSGRPRSYGGSYRRSRFDVGRIDDENEFRPREVPAVVDLGDPANHLRIVMASDYSARKIMNFSEFRMFRAVEDELRAYGHGFRVFSQTALGQVLQSPSELGHRAINSKRVDVLIVASNGMPVAVLEYQGKGHYQRDAAARDAVKREALRKAGVGYIEVLDFHDESYVRQIVRETLQRWQADRRTPVDAKSSPPRPVAATAGATPNDDGSIY